jgi:hypothetical protein
MMLFEGKILEKSIAESTLSLVSPASVASNQADSGEQKVTRLTQQF